MRLHALVPLSSKLIVGDGHIGGDMTIQLKRWFYPTSLLLVILLGGCAKTNTLPDFGPLRSEVEALYLNYHELKVVDSDLHAAARRHIEQSGQQLPEIQSAARFITQANLIAYYQWELLSITEYVRDSARSDFFTLRAQDVADARQKSEDLIMAIKVYDAFIRDPQALALIEKGIARIQQNIAIYDALYELMAPLANKPAPPPAGGVQTSL
jgi:hypothetical protein